jgi:ligand-binding sensor domain-containing protein/signal transduction histidine kinase
MSIAHGMSQFVRCPLKLLCSRSWNVITQLWLIVAMLVAVAGAGRAANAARTGFQLSEYQKQNWQVEEGLPENNVRMITQRPDGLLLLAMSSGLAIFDGLHFQSFSIPGDVDGEAVNAVLVGRNGDLWIGTDGRGVLQYSGSGTTNNISELAGRMNERIRMLYEDASGSLWIATQNGIERYRDGQLKVFTEAGMISGDITSPFAEDDHSGIFFVTSNGLFHLTNGKPEPYTLRNAALGKPVAVYRDAQHRLWVGTVNGVVRLVPRKGSSRYDEVLAARVKSPVTVLLGDAQGDLWFGTRHDGIGRITDDGVTSWTSRNGLPDDTISSLFIDNEQNLWIGMETGGLSRWRKAPFAAYGEPEGLPTTYAANVFADSHGDIWLGTWGNGLYRIHNGKLVNATPPRLSATIPIRALAENHDGHLWVGTWFDGVYRYDGRSFRHYLLGNESPGNAVSSILVDRKGGLWIGTYTGLLYFANGEPEAKGRSLFLDSKLITCILEDPDGSILVGASTGLFRVRDGHSYPITDLPHPHVISLMRDSLGYTWIGTKGGGLSLLRNDRAETLNAKSGLPMLPVRTAIEDGKGYLWLGTSHGVVRVSVAALHAVADGKESYLAPVLFGRADGMRSSECSSPSMPGSARAVDGTLWFATTTGFARTTDIGEAEMAPHPIVPVLGWTLTDDQNPEHSLAGNHVEIEAGQSDVTFLFNAIHLSNPSQIEFRYRLAGYDSEWTTTHARIARYRRLPPGQYHFEVQARHSGQAWNSAVTSIPVRQRGHFYQTWYFYLAILVFVAALAVQFFKQRVQLMKGQIGVVIEERNRIARECHDTLMAGFAAISWQLEATAKIFRDGALVDTPAAKSCELARGMVAHCQAEARRIIWDLRDTGYMTNILSHALSRTLNSQELGDSPVITFRVEGEEVPLAPAYVHHLVCIGQEAVSNAMRHASPSHIAVHLRYEADALNLTIRDDGSGFRGDSSKVGHFGIPVMEERARKVGGILRLQSSHDEGTEVSVNVSFNALQSVSRQQPQYIVPWIGI